MNKTRYLQEIISVIALLGVILSACSSPPTPEGPAVITFAYPAYLSYFTRLNFRELADAFNQANPDLEVHLRAITIQESSEVKDFFDDIMLNEEWAIDAFFYNGGRVLNGLAKSGRILNVHPMLKADHAWELDDFYPSVLAQFQYDGDLWGIPGEVVPWVVFFNKNLFDLAGVAYPPPDWTWDNFLVTAIGLRKALPERYLPFAGGCDAAVPFIYAHGGSLRDAARRPALDAPLTVEALQWYVDLALVHEVMPTLAQAEAYEPEPREGILAGVSVSLYGEGEVSEGKKRIAYANALLKMAADYGDVAMWISPLSERGGLQDLKWDFDWGIVPLPRDAVEVAMVETYGYYITAHSRHPQGALRWIEYLTRHRTDILGIPARRSVAQGMAFREALVREIGVEGFDACLHRLEAGQPVDATLTYLAPIYLGDALFDIYEHGEDVETALRKAQQKLFEQ